MAYTDEQVDNEYTKFLRPLVWKIYNTIGMKNLHGKIQSVFDLLFPIFFCFGNPNISGKLRFVSIFVLWR